MQVTVTGGVGHGAAALQYSAHDIADKTAIALSATIDNSYGRAIYYNPSRPPITPSVGYLIVRTNVASHVINAQGFGAIVDENTGVGSTIKGGGNADGQIVLASNGGLTFSAQSGATTVVAGGGGNHISFSHDAGTSAVYTSTGNDTIIGGDGNTTISAGAGDNSIVLGGGASLVQVTGHDTISLGSGSDTISVSRGGGAFVVGANSVAGGGYSLTFVGGGGTIADTVLGGAGSYDIHAGNAGGRFTGGAAGHNLIVGGIGAVTITGGGAGDTLKGGAAGHNLIVGGTGAVTINGGGAGDTLKGGAGADYVGAALGNETLTGGGGNNTFNLEIHTVVGKGGLSTTDLITDFNANDKLNVGGTAVINYAINTYQMTAAGGVFYLEDGTKVVLQGFHGTLTNSDFKH